jgi:hypothetical protein
MINENEDAQYKRVKYEQEQFEAHIKTLKDFLQVTLGDVASDKGLIIAGIVALYEDIRDEVTPPHDVQIAYHRIKADASSFIEGG